MLGTYVEQFDLDGNFIKAFDSFKEAAKATGIPVGQISRLVFGEVVIPRKPQYLFLAKYRTTKWASDVNSHPETVGNYFAQPQAHYIKENGIIKHKKKQ